MNKSKFTTLFIVTQVIYLTMIFITIPIIMEFSQWNKLIDMMPSWYTFEYVNNLLNILWKEWISNYLFPQLTLDFIYPWLFIITYYHAIKLLWNNNNYILLLPIIAWISDYIENIFLLIILKWYDFSETYINIMSYFSVSKALFTTLTFIIILFFIFKIIYLKIKKS
jgi:hypothetical protein